MIFDGKIDLDVPVQKAYILGTVPPAATPRG